MELDGILEKIPSTEKIFAIAWILSWVLAIWAYHLQFFLTGVFCLFLTLLLLGKLDKSKEKHIYPKKTAVFTMDKSTNTLKVQKLYENNLRWEDHEICAGSASLPSGPIKEGDTVKDCKGNLALRHVPSNTLFGGFNFEE
jgi:hypothetical protein